MTKHHYFCKVQGLTSPESSCLPNTVAVMTKGLVRYYASASLVKSYPDLHWKTLVQKDFCMLKILISIVSYLPSVDRGSAEIP